MPYPKWILTFVVILMMGVVAVAQDVTLSDGTESLPDNLVVVWVEHGNLFARAGENSPVQLTTAGDVIIPYLSPDGLHVAYLQGEKGLPLALSLVELADGTARQVVNSEGLSSGEDNQLLINQVEWLDGSTLYLNTARQSSFGQDRCDDLWRVNIQTDEVTLLLPPGEGGAFSISPDRKWVSIISAGEYDHEDARIRLLDASKGKIQEFLAFAAVSTGSEYRFYPQVFWETKSSAFRVAIPDRDLIYDELKSMPAVLWRIGIDGSSEKTGSVSASFFGLPSWSHDGQHLAYLRRTGAISSNQFDLFLADGDGENSIKYASGEAGSFGFPVWLPGSTQFIFAQGEPGTYWLGSPVTQPVRLAGSMFNFTFLTDWQIVYASAPVSPFELRYRHVGDNSPLLIAAIEDPFPGFDAVISREN